MNFQETKRPEISAFMLVAILVGGILSALGGGDLVNFVTGCVLIGGGCWATGQVGRWLWWRFTTQRVDAMLR